MAFLANATAYTMTLYYEHASAAANNRLALPNSRNVDIPPGGIAVLGYARHRFDGAFSRPLGSSGQH